jgi:hypothetical protein
MNSVPDTESSVTERSLSPNYADSPFLPSVNEASLTEISRTAKVTSTNLGANNIEKRTTTRKVSSRRKLGRSGESCPLTQKWVFDSKTKCVRKFQYPFYQKPRKSQHANIKIFLGKTLRLINFCRITYGKKMKKHNQRTATIFRQCSST